VAHDGHSKTVVISGTIQAIDTNQILIEALADESFHLNHVWIVTTESTRYKRGKSRVGAVATELMTGDRIVAVATRECSRRLIAPSDRADQRATSAHRGKETGRSGSVDLHPVKRPHLSRSGGRCSAEPVQPPRRCAKFSSKFNGGVSRFSNAYHEARAPVQSVK
jgi:hypothetical protein